MRASSAHERHPARSEYLPSPACRPCAAMRASRRPSALRPRSRRASAGALVAHVRFCGARSAPLTVSKVSVIPLIARRILLISVSHSHTLVWCNLGTPCKSAAHISHKCSHEASVENVTFFPAPSRSVMRKCDMLTSPLSSWEASCKCDDLPCDTHLFSSHRGAERAGGATARGGGGDGGRRGRRQARCRRSGDGRYSDRAGRRQTAPHADAAPRRNPPEPAVRRTSGHALAQR